VHRGLDLVISVRDDMVSADGGKPGTFEGHKRVWNAIRPALVALDPTYKGDDEAFCAAYQRRRRVQRRRQFDFRDVPRNV